MANWSPIKSITVNSQPEWKCYISCAIHFSYRFTLLSNNHFYCGHFTSLFINYPYLFYLKKNLSSLIIVRYQTTGLTLPTIEKKCIQLWYD